MTHIGTQFSPFGIDSAIGKLNQVECVVDVGLQVVNGNMELLAVILELTGQSYANHRQRSSTDFLRKQEELIEAQSVALEIVRIHAMRECVVPAVLVQRTILHGAYGIFPLIAGCQVSTLHNTTAREAEYTGFQVSQILHEVSTQQTLPCIVWEK